jgi:hypothetical protein
MYAPLAASFFHDILNPLGYCATAGSRAAVSGCRGYNFWSGIGSDFGQLTLLTAVIGLGIASWRRHNCEVGGCWRLCWHHTAAGDHVCKRHHPVGPKTHEQVLDDHHAAVEASADRS